MILLTNALYYYFMIWIMSGPAAQIRLQIELIAKEDGLQKDLEVVS